MQPHGAPIKPRYSVNLAVLIVNFRTPRLVEDCLDSLAAEFAGRAGWTCWVADGGSQDDSVERLPAHIERRGYSWARFVDLEHNGGFAYGNNRLIERAFDVSAEQRPDYVLLLNPDTVVRPGAIAALVEFLEANPSAGLAGSRLEDPDGTLQASSFRFPSIAGEFNGQLRFGPVHRLLARWATVAPQPQDAPSRTDWVAGASLMIRAEVLERIGLMDEAYFLYYEETDFCLRAAQAGWTCHYVPSSRVVHLVGQSSGVTHPGDRAKRLPQFWFESRARYLAKHASWLGAKAIDWAALAGFALGRLKRRLAGQSDQDPARFAGDLWRWSLNSTYAGHAPPVEPRLPEATAGRLSGSR